MPRVVPRVAPTGHARSPVRFRFVHPLSAVRQAVVAIRARAARAPLAHLAHGSFGCGAADSQETDSRLQITIAMPPWQIPTAASDLNQRIGTLTVRVAQPCALWKFRAQ